MRILRMFEDTFSFEAAHMVINFPGIYTVSVYADSAGQTWYRQFNRSRGTDLEHINAKLCVSVCACVCACVCVLFVCFVLFCFCFFMFFVVVVVVFQDFTVLHHSAYHHENTPI